MTLAELKYQADSLKARKIALMTVRERAQIESAKSLLDRIFARRCAALDIEPGYGDEDHDEIASPARAASSHLETMLEGEDDERRRLLLLEQYPC